MDHISVCVCTYRRPSALERLLAKLALQERADSFSLSVVIVDNDATGSAGNVVRRAKHALRLSVTYGIEPVRTIPAARNHALRLATGNYIAIIDDDEFPPADWLLTMYRAIHTFDADGTLGPVHPFFDSTPPNWLLRSKFCERPVVRTGTVLHWGQTRTGNVLLKREVFDRDNLRFDERMTTGGTDREFFKQAMRLGRRFVAVAEAPVYEIVPPERWTKVYWLKRALVNGFNSHTNNKDQMKGIAWAVQAAKCMAAVAAYAVALPAAVCLGTHVWMNCMERGTHHFSRLCAMFGLQWVKKRSF